MLPQNIGRRRRGVTESDVVITGFASTLVGQIPCLRSFIIW